MALLNSKAAVENEPRVKGALPNWAQVITNHKSQIANHTPPPRNHDPRQGCVVHLANRTILPPLMPPSKARVPSVPRAKPSRRGTWPIVISACGVADSGFRKHIEALGARIIGPLGGGALLIEANAKTWQALHKSDAIEICEAFMPSDKCSPQLAEKIASGGRTKVTILPLAAEDKEDVAAAITAAGGHILTSSREDLALVRAEIETAQIDTLVSRGDVRWIEPYERFRLLNDVAAGENGVHVQKSRDVHGLTGKGQYIAFADSGVDSGELDETMHADLRNRICQFQKFNTIERESNGMVYTAKHTKDYCGHGTHVAGSIVGDGSLTNGLITGMAPGAMLVAQCVGTDQEPTQGYMILPSYETLFSKDRDTYPYAIHSDSWGGGTGYTTDSIAVDTWIWAHPDLLTIFAAGNVPSNSLCYYTTSAPSTAKNCISVGATQNDRPEYKVYSGRFEMYQAGYPNKVTTFSCCGPLPDGRVKPDVVAPGAWVLSTRSRYAPDKAYYDIAANTNYAFNSGTSMATPLVAGCAALVREWLVTRRGFTNPSAALLKAILLGGADDLYGTANSNVAGAVPFFDQGWGRVNVADSLYPEDNRAIYLADYIPFKQGHVWKLSLTTTKSANLDVQLVWIDYPGTSGASRAIVNDLDLIVMDPAGTTHYGNGGTAPNTVDTVESVRLKAAQAGTYSIMVRSALVSYDSTLGGAAAIYVRGAFETNLVEILESEEQMLTRYSYVPDESIHLAAPIEEWFPAGTYVELLFPESSPVGVEIVTTNASTYRAGALQILNSNNYSAVNPQPLDGGTGAMPTKYSCRLNADITMAYFHYYNVTNLMEGTSIPTWWYLKNLYKWAEWCGLESDEAAAADFDGDGISNAREYEADTDPNKADSAFRILTVSRTNLLWCGGTECKQVVEATSELGPAAIWMDVQTFLPPTAATNSYDIPADSTFHFYRVRAIR